MNSFGLFLKKITLNNFATFEDQEIEFDKNFNAIIGETGSGKSLILDAIQLILGQRADKKLIRFGSEFSTIEAIFNCTDKEVKNYFFDQGFPFEGEEVTIKRVLYKSGKTKSFLNHQSCSLSSLSHFSSQFIDLVGQFENQKLLSESYQLNLLDNYSGLTNKVQNYQDIFERILKKQKELDLLKEKNSQTATRLDYISFQINELSSLNPSSEDEDQLILTKKKLHDFEAFKNNLIEINTIFNGEDNSDGLFNLVSRLEKLLDEKFASLEQISSFTNAKEIFNDLSYSLNSNQNEDISENEFEDVLERLDQYQKLKRKFNTDTLGLEKLLAEFQLEKEELSNIDKDLSKLEDEISEYKLEAFVIAEQLHASRIKGAKKLSTSLTQAIQELMMKGATIDVALSENEELNRFGLTSVSLNSETNKGEGFFRVKDIASGGELSRILLAMRKVLASKDSISIFLFDEIDAGIGGETALTIGKSLCDVATNSQVIAITHLPQIANYSQKLIVVDKSFIDKDNETRTISKVREVIGQSLKEEVISMTPLN